MTRFMGTVLFKFAHAVMALDQPILSAGAISRVWSLPNLPQSRSAAREGGAEQSRPAYACVETTAAKDQIVVSSSLRAPQTCVDYETFCQFGTLPTRLGS